MPKLICRWFWIVLNRTHDDDEFIGGNTLIKYCPADSSDPTAPPPFERETPSSRRMSTRWTCKQIVIVGTYHFCCNYCSNASTGAKTDRVCHPMIFPLSNGVQYRPRTATTWMGSGHRHILGRQMTMKVPLHACYAWPLAAGRAINDHVPCLVF